MHRKTPILGPRSSVTPDAIDLKFGTRDYIVGATQHAKNYSNRPRGAPGNGVKYHVQMFFFIYFVCDYLRSSGEHIFGSIATVFASNDVFRRGLIS